MEQYDCLNKAQLSFEYLHTNSTTHTFLFGALAELVDNSRDAGARNLAIYTCEDPCLRGGFYLAFLDDGCGMYYDDVFNVIVFGKSAKRHAPDSNQIGRYGNGLKSGAMRIANDLLLLTKKDHIGTCLFLSRSFHQEEHISQVICPMPCFNLRTHQPIQNTDCQELNGTHTYTFDQIKHELEMSLITKYSPFKTIDDLLKQFNLITTSSGTLIILYHVKLSDNGQSELDIKTDPFDILIDSSNRRNLFDNDDDSTPLEYRSLRAYLSILYYEPRMRITIQRRRIITKKLPHTLYKPRQYLFKSARFKTRSEQEIKKYEQELELLEESKREADSQVYYLQQSLGVTRSIDERTRLRKLQVNAAKLKDMLMHLRNGLTRKKSEMNTTKTLTFIFGLNIQNRTADGIFVYNCGRLIKMYEKIGLPNKKAVYCRGVVGVVDIPSIVLEPTHNKQSFADEKEYYFLLKNLGEYMRQYWSDAGIENYVKEFWETYGYRDDQLDRPPSNEPDVVKRRQAAIPLLIQCDQCLKWRRLPYSSNAPPLTQAEMEIWQCSDNTDVMNNACSISEKLETIPEGELTQKSQVSNAQNRVLSKATLPLFPTSLSSASLLSTRSSGINKRISNAEISSTTVANSKSVSTRSSTLPLSIVASKQSVPLSAKSKRNKKRKRPISQQSNKSKSKNCEATSSNEEEDDDDDDDEEELSTPIAQRARSHTPLKNSKNIPKSKQSTSSRISHLTTDNHKNSNNSQITLSTSKNYVHSNNEEMNHTNTSNVNYRPLPPTIGARVSTMYQGARRSGTVLSVNDKRSIFKVRFDEFPTAEFDYTLSYKSSDWSYIIRPLSSSSSNSLVTNNESLSTIVRKFKALIKFMLPPDWNVTSEQITLMNNDELSQFNVEQFMQSYREKMTQIIEQRKADEARWRVTAERMQAKVTELLNLNRMPIPVECSMDDFEHHIQDYLTQTEKQQYTSS